MANELIIEEYKKFYKRLQPLNGSRFTVVRTLEDYLQRLCPFVQAMKNQKLIRREELNSLQYKIDQLLKSTFPEGVFKTYHYPPKFEKNYSAVKGNIAENIAVELILNQLKSITAKHSEEKIHNITFQYNFLRKIYTCLKDYGLHSEIQKRESGNLQCNVLIEHDSDKKNKVREGVYLISLDKLMHSIIEPYHAEKPILIKGVKILPKNNKRTTITTTLLKDDEIPFFKEKQSCRTDLDFATACKDETVRLLDDALISKETSTNGLRAVPFVADLINNPNISRVVLDAYYALVPQPTSRDQVSTAYVGDLKHYNQPFRAKVYGAYPLMIDWELQHHKIENGYFSQYGIQRSEVEIHLRKYGEAFVDGFHSFEDKVLSGKSMVFQEISDKEQAIFDYATNWFLNRSGFPEAHEVSRHLLSAWPEAGKQAGYFYRAWYIILQHSKRFEQLFLKANETRDEFLDKFIEGIAKLQVQDTAHQFIRQLREGYKKDEGSFRTWFWTWFQGAGYDSVEAEPLKGNGRIDLKIVDKRFGKKIIEFKGWWNKDKDGLAEQVTRYLTDFEGAGYILLVNHLKTKDILKEYQKIVEAPETGYVKGTFKELTHPNTHFLYYVSQHKLGNRSKTLYHLIYRLYP